MLRFQQVTVNLAPKLFVRRKNLQLLVVYLFVTKFTGQDCHHLGLESKS